MGNHPRVYGLELPIIKISKEAGYFNLKPRSLFFSKVNPSLLCERSPPVVLLQVPIKKRGSKLEL